jgi:hypothetical protein
MTGHLVAPKTPAVEELNSAIRNRTTDVGVVAFVWECTAPSCFNTVWLRPSAFYSLRCDPTCTAPAREHRRAPSQEAA